MNENGDGTYKAGQLWNPIYASIITARVRLKIMEAIMRNPKAVVQILTDAIMTDEPFMLACSAELGGWRARGEGEALVFGAGVYTLRSKDGLRTKHRGFKFTTEVDFIEMIRASPEISEYVIYKESPYPLSYALMRGDFGRACCFEQVPIKLSVNMDRKRMWKKVRNGGELLEGSYNSVMIPLYEFMRNA